MKLKKFCELKVYQNKRTGQRTVVLPKKLIGIVKRVKVSW